MSSVFMANKFGEGESGFVVRHNKKSVGGARGEWLEGKGSKLIRER